MMEYMNGGSSRKGFLQFVALNLQHGGGAVGFRRSVSRRIVAGRPPRVILVVVVRRRARLLRGVR
jgi:hypothetical protein